MGRGLYWTSEWDGEPGESMKVHQLLKNGRVVAYIKQETDVDMGSEYAYIRGNFRPVFAGVDSSISSIKQGLEDWAAGKVDLPVMGVW